MSVIQASALAAVVGMFTVCVEGRPADVPSTMPALRGAEHRIKRVELKQSSVVDALRLISELTGLNAAATEAAGSKQVTLFLQNVTAQEAIDTICKVSGLWYRSDPETRAIRVMTTEEYQKDLVVFREDQVKVFTLLHPNPVSVASAIADLYGERVILSLGIDEEAFTAGGAGALGGVDRVGGLGAVGGMGGYGSLGMGQGLGAGGYGYLGAAGGIGGQQFRRTIGGSDHYPYAGDQRAGGSAQQSSAEAVDTAERAARVAQLQQDGKVSVEDLRQATGERGPEPLIYITVNRQHNLVIARTSDATAMEDIERLIVQMDRPTPQVLLEMKVLELAVGDSFRSAVDIGYAAGERSSGPETGQPANPLQPSGATAPRNVLGTGNFPTEGGTLVYQFLNDHVRARIQLLQRENRVTTLATPLLLASNNRPARVFVGEERVLTTGVRTNVITPATGATFTSVTPVTEVRDIGNTLIIIPRINADKTVTLTISQDSSSVQPNGASIPVATSEGGIRQIAIDSVNTANLQGTVVAKDGLTIAVGGLIRNSVSDDEQKVPILGDIPVLDLLFSRKTKLRNRSELILLITPHVLMTPAEGQETTRHRLEKLSRHPYMEKGDAALDHHFDKDKREDGYPSSVPMSIQ